MTTERPLSPSPRVSPWRLRFILLGGGIAWFAQLVFAYLIAEFGVLTGLHRTLWGGISAVAWMLAGLSVLMFAIGALASGAAWSARADDNAWVDDTEQNSHVARFCRRFGLSSNLAFTLLIAIQTIPIFYFLRP